MTNTTHVQSLGDDRGDTAAYLLALAAERGYPASVVKRVFGGYEVPVGLLEVGDTPAIGHLPAPAKVTGKGDVTADAPDWYFEEKRPVDVEQDEDGAIYVKPEAAAAIVEELGTTVEALNESHDPNVVAASDEREIIRAWAKEQGLQVADKGALKKSVIEEYQRTH